MLSELTMDAKLMRCNSCAIRHRAVCGALSESELEEINSIARSKFIPAGQTVMADHEPSEFFANIVSGVIKLTKMMADGRQQIVGLQFASDFVGRAYSSRNPYFAEAASDVELCSFPRDDFEKLMASHPGLEHRLFEKTLDELDSCRD